MVDNPNPITTLKDAAIAVHEMFISFIEAGFTRQEALALTINMINQSKPKDFK